MFKYFLGMWEVTQSGVSDQDEGENTCFKEEVAGRSIH
jgi:hypothetical protein